MDVLEDPRKIDRIADPHTGGDLLDGRRIVFEHLPGSLQFYLPEVLSSREAERLPEQMAETGGRQAYAKGDLFNRDIAMRVVMNVLPGSFYSRGSRLSIERSATPFGAIPLGVQCNGLIPFSPHERLTEKAFALPRQTQQNNRQYRRAVREISAVFDMIAPGGCRD